MERTREQMYDYLCYVLDAYFESFNPCDIRIGKDGCWTCTGKTVCCNDCEYLRDDQTGCDIQCLGCKLYICYSLQKKDPELKAFLKKLEAVAHRYKLVAMRTPKEELFK